MKPSDRERGRNGGCPRCGSRLETVRTGTFMGEPTWGVRCIRCGYTEGEN